MSAVGANVSRNIAAPGAPSPAIQSFARAWQERSAVWPGADTPMRALRREAMARFERLGLPTLRDESWHYSNLRALNARKFRTPTIAMPAVEETAPCSWLDGLGAWPRIQMRNGVAPSGTLTMPAGMHIRSLRSIEQTDPQRLASLLPALDDAEGQRWALLNTALFDDGLHIRITGHCAVPLLIVHAMALGAEVESQEMVQPRVIIEVERGASAVIIEHHVSAGPRAFLSNSVTSIALQEASRLEHFRVFSAAAAATHTDLLQVRASEHSHLRQHTVVLGGGFVRTGLEANLEAAGAMLDSYSLLTGHDSRHTDCVNIVRHAAPHTQSRQTARIIASGRSRAIFNSKVVVNRGAQKADSQQSCRGLLLSPTAEIDSRPQLEINADDVKCAHGATTGRLDPDMLFYMLSRGLDRNAAQSLLVFAFLADALTDMSIPAVRSAVESQLIAQLPDSQLLRQFR